MGLHSNQSQTHVQHQDHSSHQLHSNQLSQTHVQPHNHKLSEDVHQHGHGDVQLDELADVPDVIVVVVTVPVSVSQQNSDVKKLITKTVEQRNFLMKIRNGHFSTTTKSTRIIL